MDRVSRIFHEQALTIRLLRERGDGYQNLFCAVMEKRHPEDFVRVKPWGRSGDQKCDGYVLSTGQFFQVYAPDELREADTMRKIREDFDGAILHWKGRIRTWTFVHNGHDGLSPNVQKLLLDLPKEQPIDVAQWGPERIRQEVFSLAEPDVAAILGPAPTEADYRGVGFEQLKVVLAAVGQLAPAPLDDVRPVPPEKLAANALSRSARDFLTLGMQRSRLVRDFFRKWHDPLLGDRVAEAFRAEYQALKAGNLLPDDIFGRLQKFALGGLRGTPAHEIAALAVLAHLFEECDIFERPHDGGAK
jgi:hypothetical protein